MKKLSYYVYSTLSSDVDYTVYDKGGGDVPVKAGSVLVKGGTGVADKRIITPTGAVPTAITAEEYELLKDNSVFQQHEKNGFVVVKDKLQDGEKVATGGMESRDASAPLTETDFAEGEAPTTGKTKK